MYEPKVRKDAGGAGGAGAPPNSGSKPWENPSGDIPPVPSTPPPEGYQWQLQTDSRGRKFWGVVAAAVIGAVGSYLSARQANKPRTGYTDQTTTQSPYLAGMIQPDLEAILTFQRMLINQGPSYVGPQSTWPTQRASQAGFAPGPVNSTYVNYDTWRPTEPPRWNPGTPQRAPGGYSSGPGLSGHTSSAGLSRLASLKRGGPGDETEIGDLNYLRDLFAATRGRG